MACDNINDEPLCVRFSLLEFRTPKWYTGLSEAGAS